MVASTAPLASLSQKLVKSRHCLHATELKCESNRTECEKSKQLVEENDAAISAMEGQERKLKMQCAPRACETPARRRPVVFMPMPIVASRQTLLVSPTLLWPCAHKFTRRRRGKAGL